MGNEIYTSSVHQLPVLALRGIVLFPGTVLHFDVNRSKSKAALEYALKNDKEIFVVSQINIEDKAPGLRGLNKVGVIATVRQVVRVPNSGMLRVAVEGFTRAKINSLISDDGFMLCDVEEIYPMYDSGYSGDYETALVREAKTLFADYASLQTKVSREVAVKIVSIASANELSDYIGANITVDAHTKQRLLEQINPVERLLDLCTVLKSETQLLELENNIRARIKENIDENQREYYLKEQLRAVNEELNGEDSPQSEVEEYKQKIKDVGFEEKTEKKLFKEAEKLLKMSPGSQDAYVIRNYLDTVLELPWNKFSEDNLDIINAKKVLDDDHYGMEDVKQRIIELLAVRKLNPDIKGQIICLVGPPGVGKTSIAKSLASAMGREYVRIALGGVSDEAEIRGHRKTYIGAMNGRIIAAVNEAGTSNPLILLDEIDKLSKDYKGDPASALLEVLDGEQNFSFKDHFIEIPYDLSKVLFITTANDASAIPAPLYDRMEIIELSGYTAAEKFNIAKRHLVSKQMKRHGLNGNMVRISDAAIKKIIENYTSEAGVRTLEREIGALMRKAAAVIAHGDKKRISFTDKSLGEYLGVEKFKSEKILPVDSVGVVNGLAWTAVGGTVLQVEALVLDGTGKTILTGSLGDVMKESASAAVSYIRKIAHFYGIDTEFYKDKDIHLHFPAGATPKDGPSAGVTISTALISALTGIPVRRDVAMTGEITLTGRVLPIGGLKEKAVGAYTAGVKTVIIPSENVSDLTKIPEEVKEKIDFIPVDNIKDVFDIALCEHIEIKASEEYQNNDIYFANADIHSEAEVVH